MAGSSFSKLLIRRQLLARFRSSPPLFSSSSSTLLGAPQLREASTAPRVGGDGALVAPSRASHWIDSSRTLSRASFSSRASDIDESQAPAAIDYRSMMPEEEFHRLADDTIHSLQEKFEEYGDSLQMDGYDVDYGNHVLTLKLGSLGTYVINKQTPNRQIWLSSPVSGPSRFDWDSATKGWVYRRTKAKLLQLLEEELEQLCGQHIDLS
ncbi:frataxin, mitochondrial [Ananas comosus]|uniref:ferroxidase n=1 Tax=Ananas comosus TaxID=4615 RepID=A0A199VXW4_ANACO|nr:frataxin, mitochondrial [Ananas comosus]OAY82087.1 Frataxin, mitochondrial [Ananas comosus]